MTKIAVIDNINADKVAVVSLDTIINKLGFLQGKMS